MLKRCLPLGAVEGDAREDKECSGFALGDTVNPFLCLDCDGVVEPDKHGRCSVCNSDAIMRMTVLQIDIQERHLDLIARLWPAERLDMESELERIYLEAAR